MEIKTIVIIMRFKQNLFYKLSLAVQVLLSNENNLMLLCMSHSLQDLTVVEHMGSHTLECSVQVGKPRWQMLQCQWLHKLHWF